MNAEFHPENVPVAKLHRGPSRILWFAFGFVAALGLVGAGAVACVAGIALAVEKPARHGHHAAEDFLREMSGGRATRAATLTSPAVASGLEAVAKSQAGVWGPKFRLRSRHCTGDLVLGERGIRAVERVESLWEVEGKDGQKRDVALVLESGVVTEIWIGGECVLPVAPEPPSITVPAPKAIEPPSPVVEPEEER
ncbi:MAG: hypothetical protein HYY18_06640 [Planctomycetes bacterium]|nr:hypothetical protein [Planctomycetota bacterium]